MRNVDFKKVKGLSGISKYFYIPEDTLQNLVEAEDQSIFYEEYKIRKKNYKNAGKYRVVYKAEPEIARLHKNIATAISENVEFPECVQGFVKKRSPYSNAKQHLECNFLLNADIENFFDSIKIDSVVSVFIQLGCDNATALLFAKICTINGILSQGQHTSPIISNLVVQKMDSDMQTLSARYFATYTRYSDDISISSDSELPKKEELEEVLKNHGFLLNEDKFRVSKRGQAQFVTGLSVFDGQYPRVPKYIKRNVRLQIYYIKKYGIADHFERMGVPELAYEFYYNKVRGTVDYINAIEPDLAEKLYDQLPMI